MAKDLKTIKKIPQKIGFHVVVDIRSGEEFIRDDHEALQALINHYNDNMEQFTAKENTDIQKEGILKMVSHQLGDMGKVLSMESLLGGKEGSDSNNYFEDYDIPDHVETFGPFYTICGCNHSKCLPAAAELFVNLVSKLDEIGSDVVTMELLEEAAFANIAIKTLKGQRQHESEDEDE